MEIDDDALSIPSSGTASVVSIQKMEAVIRTPMKKYEHPLLGFMERGPLFPGTSIDLMYKD